MARIRCFQIILFTLVASLCADARVAEAQPRPTFIAPQYVIPEPPVPWKAPAPDVAPRDLVLPINLPTALKLVNARSMDVAIASQRITQADAQLDQARYAWLPTITLGGDYLRHDGRFQDVVGKIVSPSRTSFMAGAGVNAIFTPADAIFAPLAARQVVRARVADLDAVANNSVLAVAEAYFNVQQARGELAGGQVTLVHAEELVRRTEKLAAGLAPPVEAIRARSELARRKQAVYSFQERWQVASAELIRVLRLDSSAVIEPIEPPHLRVPLVPLDQPIDALIPVGLRNRPELSSQQALIEATLQRLRQERIRPLIPSLVLRGTGANPPGLFSVGVMGGGSDAMSKYGIRGDIEVQVVWEFQNLLFGNTAKVHDRRAENQIAILEMFRLQDRIAAEIATAYAQTQSAARRLGDAESGLKDAAESVDKNFQGLKQTRMAGDLMILVVRPQEVIASIQTLTQAYADYYGAVGDFNRAQFRLYRALGHPAQAIAGCDATSAPLPITSGTSPSRRD